MSAPSTTDPAITAAERAGFDLNLIDCNLALSPEQRLLRHDAALELAQELRKAGEARYAQPAPAPAKAR
ncbi:hypothetical protein K0B96_13185 [Horticoccus luteus]|uniref:Uncharacterized protein n=2 Tax=Horticoccus luteus TaxID=2862869 RepID=A0A8F9TZ73_9BACT|nr:hypothetical protein K0B96_13185 [Horticoccus luteus]